jgi:signal transduction histidine kinase/ActR/RegA family two-component response regulator
VGGSTGEAHTREEDGEEGREEDGKEDGEEDREEALTPRRPPWWMLGVEHRSSSRPAAAAIEPLSLVSSSDLPPNEERFSLALAAARMVMWEWDGSRGELTHSGVARELMGLPPGSPITADTLRDIVHPEDQAFHAHAVRGPMLRGEPFAARYRVIRPIDGAILWIESRGTGICDESGKLIRARGVVMDVTARVEAEEQRHEAELRSQLKDEFLARVSHELRTPLAAMRLWLQVLRSGLPQDREAAMDAIDVAARAQSKLIEDLLDLARGVNGKLRIASDIVDPRVPIEEAVSVMRPEAEAKSILLFTALASDAGFIRGDAARLAQVMANLLSNAIKFTPAGGRIEVLLREGGGRVVITVSDSGIGIDAAALESVFMPFRQHDGAGQGGGGLGLGLAIARQLVELHGGSIRAESGGEGRGATFSVMLPRLADDEQPTPSQRRRANTAALPLEGMRVLVVEDHGATREGMARLLLSYGAEVTACASGPEAFESLRRALPDAIISDLEMPDEDGCSFLQRVRALGGPAARTPALALTAHARPEDAARAMAAGFFMHIAKPVDSDFLVETLVTITGRGGAAQRSLGGRRRKPRSWS